MKKILIILLILMAYSCNNNELGGDYHFLRDYESVDVGYPYGSIVYKSKEVNSYEDILIYSDVKECISDDNNIIVHQVPNEGLAKKRILDDLEFWNKYFLNSKKDSLIDLTFEKIYLKNINAIVENGNKQAKVDSILKYGTYYKKLFHNKDNYYIIDKRRNLVYGPLNNIEFKAMKNKKNIDLDF